jgi:hypothetical protein
MDSLYVVLMLVVSPFALGVLLTIFLRRVLHLRSRTFEFVEFALLSISVLVILVDFISYKENSELRHLRDEIAGKQQTLLPMMDSLQRKICEKADAAMEERVKKMCAQQPTKTPDEVMQSLKCEEVVRKVTKDVYSGNCREIAELHNRWITNAQQSTFFNGIPSKERFADEYRKDLDNISNTIDKANSSRASMNEIESFEAKGQRVAYEFVGKGILTFMVALGLGIGTTRRVLDWRAEAAAK